MKQNHIILIVIGFLLVALMATNPSSEEHKEAVKEKVSAAFENNNSDGNAFQKLGEQLGQTIGKALIDKEIKRENYFIFSIIKVQQVRGLTRTRKWEEGWGKLKEKTQSNNREMRERESNQ